MAQGTHEAIEGHGRDMPNHRTQLQTQPAMRRQQGIAGHLGAYGAIAKDEMRQDREDGFARGALDAPDGEPTQPDTDIMRVAGETPTAATSGRVGELQAQGQNKSEDELDKRLAIVQ